MNIYFPFLLLFLLPIFHINAEPLVTISLGILNGTVQNSRYGRKFSAFLGIPYAKPPVGNLRFANPEPADNWAGIRPANSFGNVCPQPEGERIVGNEDCLFLNVYSPFLDFSSSLPNNTLLPVMVWIHGGGFSIGSSNSYEAGYLLEKNIVLVTINYRLGIFGFFSTADSVAPGNFGMKDQVLALKWIQKNIKYFGGNPNKVTLFGQSAGGASVSLLAVSKASTGLFHQYIIQSGAVMSHWLYQKSSNFFTHSRKISGLVMCPITTSKVLVNCLRGKNFESLVRISFPYGLIVRFGQLTWTPTDEPDVEGAFLTDDPRNLVKYNQMKDLPFMSGAVTEEGLVITSELYTNDVLYNSVRLNINKIIAYHSQYFKNSVNPIQFTAAVNKFYFKNSMLTASKDSFLDSLTKFFSDGFFLHPQIRMLEKVTPVLSNPNYFYSFGYRGKISTSSLRGGDRNIGVAHGDEVIYLFPITMGAIKISDSNFTLIDRSISNVLIDMWTSFAINGKPTSDKLNDPNLWAPYTSQNGVHIQIGNIQNNKDPSMTLSNSYYIERINFWRKNAPI